MSLGPYLIVYTHRPTRNLFCFWAGSEGEAREHYGKIVSDGATEIWLDGEDARDVPVSYVALVRVVSDYDFLAGGPRAQGHPEGQAEDAA